MPFDERADYDTYVDGKFRYDGVRSFLDSRGIELPDGAPTDPPTPATVCGLGNRKDDAVKTILRTTGVAAFPGSVRYLEAVRDAGLHRAVVSGSANCREVLQSARIESLFEERVDGVVAQSEHLRGKPAPDTYLAAARRLGVPAAYAAVFEDAIAGVEAGRAGAFGLVVGISRSGRGDELLAHGADLAISDLADLLEAA